MVISVKHFSKIYQVAQKEPGLAATIKSFFNRKYKSVDAVSDVSFTVDTGELIGFIGPNGAGKTTTLKTLSGLLHPSRGDISVLGFTPFARKRSFLKHIALVMGQKNQLWWDLPATDTFLLQKEIYELSDSEYKKTLAELVELLDVSDVLETPVRKLSLGQRMKMELIAALIHKPKVLFLDEPTIGLDVVMQQKIREFIKTYNEKYQATILLTSHYMDDVKELCKRVIVIDHGKIIYDGLLDDIVKKYATHKQLLVTLSHKVAPEKLAKVGEIIEYSYPTAILQVSRKDSNKAAIKLFKDFPVEDLNIEEPQIEEIIRQVFKGKGLG